MNVISILSLSLTLTLILFRDASAAADAPRDLPLERTPVSRSFTDGQRTILAKLDIQEDSTLHDPRLNLTAENVERGIIAAEITNAIFDNRVFTDEHGNLKMRFGSSPDSLSVDITAWKADCFKIAKAKQGYLSSRPKSK
ncbi:MAG: hypothetical protein A2977_03580 [Alphaproteobacteria bacterium RIFCSPLOWO2_01_FULL_45_8]|nr:MAG: hypothetical protein A2065_01520 [Alphaproteobacteria bacterium GWB1_45_5]OFW76623.1 MAG: hypothetical protein A3K20_00370 [Alphaproteobacteria bacterium GWA1_45_9]OFW89707.1 MAG: hypothetical protein A2621_02260 [Alphaproteobacteria bacterium RIFCSPHIGHO2_01_FULL_41_14]OFW96111.1 MAG: hypothetical protein A2977_03580 [Alphaproteobacteria bacterium RIFCSPLOWO2_01_FULL_45_8]HCI49152.1 hypothetical protein [Holosporales bacterium]